jgi:hypothetical protein
LPVLRKIFPAISARMQDLELGVDQLIMGKAQQVFELVHQVAE